MQQLTDDSADWTVKADQAITIQLVKPASGGESKGLEKVEKSFHPEYTYPIFGENETIFGYKNLKVTLTFNASDLRPHLAVSASKKFAPVGAVEAVNVMQILKDFLPPVAVQKKSEFEAAVKHIPKDWTPPGALVKTMERNGERYEVWRGSLADDGVKQLVKRIQVCILFFVEGGSYITEDEEGNDLSDSVMQRWSVFFLYKKQQSPQQQYIFQGYSTVYDFWLFDNPVTPPASAGSDTDWELPSDEFSFTQMPHRARISQFVILPPFHGQGCGAMLYNTIFALHADNPRTKEITVEDPNEAFDQLRDLCDLTYLRANFPEFASLAVNSNVSIPDRGGVLSHNTQILLNPDDEPLPGNGIVDLPALEKFRHQVKIQQRQFWRLVEIQLMSTLPSSVRPTTSGFDAQQEPAWAKKIPPPAADKKLYKLWRILLKQRVYRRNKSALGEFDQTERICRLNDAVESVEYEYSQRLTKVAGTVGLAAPGLVVGGAGAKRKSEDPDSGAAGNRDGEGHASKRSRVEGD